MAIYKFNTLTSQSMEFKSRDEQHDIKIEISLVEELQDYFNNGDFSRKDLTVNSKAWIDGKEVAHSYNVQPVDHIDGIAAVIGNVGLNAERYAKLKELNEIVKNHAEWQAKSAKRKEGEKACYEHDKFVENLEKSMTLNGKTY
jgi:hypothetical protein